MEDLIQFTYNQIIDDSRLLDLSHESAKIYNLALHTFYDYWAKNNKWLSKFGLQKEMSKNFTRTLLGSDSYIGVIQQVHSAFVSTKAAKKEYEKNPSKFTGEPKYPEKDKETNCLIFKEENIRIKGKQLWLSLCNGVEPIKTKWQPELGKPIFVLVNWDMNKGWTAHIVLEKTKKQIEDLVANKTIAIDLGINRIATIFDGKNCITFSGRYIKSLIKYREKSKKKYQEKMAKFKKHTKNWKKLNTSKRKKVARINNKINDVLHKTSRTIVNYAIEHKFSNIVIGDNASTHDSPNLGKANNQSITQGVEQKLAKQIEYKFESTGGSVGTEPEYYTTQACPRCGEHNIPKGRTYKCKACGFVCDRDCVGSMNIWGKSKNVSLGKVLGVIGGLAPPVRGWKYHPANKCSLSGVICEEL